MKRYLFAMALSAAAVTASAQNGKAEYSVEGIVADSISGQGEPYATVYITRKGETKPAGMGVADLDGRFKVSVSGNGEYVLQASSMGKLDLNRDITLNGTTRALNLGKLLMREAENYLNNVTVVGRKPLVKADIDKLTYSVEDDPEAKAVTVMDMLKKVPMVTVDGQDNIQVNGKSSFKVYVNGKPNNMMTNNPKEVLKSMPASSIKRVEVITNPGPKYDAEGVGGILNIITMGSGPEGYTATFSLNGSNRGYGGGVFATVKKGKLTVSANYNANYDKEPKSWISTGSDITDDDGRVLTSTDNDMDQHARSLWQGGSLEASYEIDSLRLITANFSLNRYRQKTTHNGSTLSCSPTTGDNLYSYDAVTNGKSVFNDISGGVDYQRTFKTPGKLLTFSYRIESTPYTTDTDIRYGNMQANESWTDFVRRIKNQYADGDQSSTEHTFQLDFTTPFAKFHTLESGVKYILRQNKAVNDKYDSPTGSDGENVYDADNSSHYKHRNDILAAYVGYGLSLKKWSARVGLRYEHTMQDVKFLLGHGENFSKNFNDVVPSAKIGYKFTDMTNISLNYKMRISRPGIWYLNPYLDDSTPERLSQGNSTLDSEKIHVFDIQFGSFGQKLSYNVSAAYGFTNNSIQNLSKAVDDRTVAGLENPTGKTVIYSSYYNVGRERNVNFSGFVSWNPLTDTRLTVNAWGGYTHISDGESQKNHGWNVSMYGQLQQTIAKTWTLSLSAYKQTPGVTLQGKTGSFFTHDVSLSKSFLDKRLNVTVAVGSPFKKYTKFHQNSYGANYKTSVDAKFCMQSFRIGASFRIGKLESSVKKVERTISNDDVKQGGGNNNGSAGMQTK